MQRSDFSTGGYVLHKVHAQGYASKFSAWFDAQGNLLDAEAIDTRGRSKSATPAQRVAIVNATAHHVPRNTKGN